MNRNSNVCYAALSVLTPRFKCEHPSFMYVLAIGIQRPPRLWPLTWQGDWPCFSRLKFSTVEYFILCSEVWLYERNEFSSLEILAGTPFTSQRGILHEPPPMCQIRGTLKKACISGVSGTSLWHFLYMLDGCSCCSIVLNVLQITTWYQCCLEAFHVPWVSQYVYDLKCCVASSHF